MSILTTLGLRTLSPGEPQSPNLAATFLISNFLFAYALLSTRGIKRLYKFDHNTSPREDVSKYGETLVREGKLDRKTLERVKRWESAHGNTVEGYSLFIGGVLLALHAGVSTQKLNGLMILYTLARVAYAASYILIEDERASFLRSVLWWTGNTSCISMMVMAGKRM
ncbi:hypothetical protein L207DRAFT_333389 [Hyaloscypha variabilis F]|uniref:Membrane-associated proteins in eicosanoid and glutathione metabolism n=1 Tax=Hyaloscypha variabilis (strain UAMH 11265 / GT02V1 / F) TaxID=1149755 RepID=A0A2J6RTQ7_HYAVF|nr:hypothetical protein L207DRAFT_333389 [Hyaloscypha variabilis F]